MVFEQIFKSGEYKMDVSVENMEEIDKTSKDLKFYFISHKKGIRENYFTLSDNIILFILRGHVEMSVGAFQKKTFDEGHTVFLPRFSSCRFIMGPDTLLVYVEFRRLRDKRNISFFNILGVEYPSLYPPFPCLTMNSLMQGYVRAIYEKLISAPSRRYVEALVPEHDFFLNLSCCYNREELALLFSPIIHNKELIM